MKKVIGYGIVALPFLIVFGIWFYLDWKIMLVAIGGILFFALCFISGAKLISDD